MNLSDKIRITSQSTGIGKLTVIASLVDLVAMTVVESGPLTETEQMQTVEELTPVLKRELIEKIRGLLLGEGHQ